MSETVYDRNVRLYVDFIDQWLDAEPSLLRTLMSIIERLAGERVRDARVLDVACGEGYLSRHLATLGPRSVLGIDISSELIAIATERNDAPNASFAVGDAHVLDGIDDASMDVVVSQMAMMDIPDHREMFASVRRVIAADGAFVFSMLHPCFDGPHQEPEHPRVELNADGEPVAVMVRIYAREGHWQSGASGLRGHVGSYHRMLSTYINDLIDTGFELVRIEEPVVPGAGLYEQVPRVIVLSARPT
jgi:ubiquinone/menaquinone biosynthesis C-methylase UbiE